MSSHIISPTIFLDTNAIHNATSYLILARRLNLRPFQPQGDIASIRATLAGVPLPKNIVDGLTNGLRVLNYLQTQVEQNGARIYTSRLALAELWNGRLDGQAHIRMATEGIPYRQRQRQGEISTLVMESLTQLDYDTVSGELTDLFSNWQSLLNIEVQVTEDNDQPNSRDISHLALEIQKTIFLDVIDCALLAESIAMLANKFITSDDHLFKVINQIHDPGIISDIDERVIWQSAQDVILQEIRTMLLNEALDKTYLVEPAKAKSLGDDISNFHGPAT